MGTVSPGLPAAAHVSWGMQEAPLAVGTLAGDAPVEALRLGRADVVLRSRLSGGPSGFPAPRVRVRALMFTGR